MDNAMNYVERNRCAAFGSPATAQTAHHGHRFDNITLQDQASAHIGDSYTNYHIYNAAQPTGSSKSPPLTITTSIAGIRTASDYVANVIDRSAAPSPALQAIKRKSSVSALFLNFFRGSWNGPVKCCMIGPCLSTSRT